MRRKISLGSISVKDCDPSNGHWCSFGQHGRPLTPKDLQDLVEANGQVFTYCIYHESLLLDSHRGICEYVGSEAGKGVDHGTCVFGNAFVLVERPPQHPNGQYK